MRQPTFPMDPRAIPKSMPPLDRIAARLIVEDSGCWTLTGSTSSTGYHSIGVNGTTHNAHRWLYEVVVGPVPEGLQLDHLCRNRACVNPDHLEPVSQSENLLRGDGFSGVNARKSVCVNGHDLVGHNVMIRKDGWRNCRECHNARRRKARTTLRPVR